jgi:hypothetical protein
MKRQSVEKSVGWGLMSGVRGMEIGGGKEENLEKRGRSKKMEEDSKAPPSKNRGEERTAR